MSEGGISAEQLGLSQKDLGLTQEKQPLLDVIQKLESKSHFTRQVIDATKTEIIPKDPKEAKKGSYIIESIESFDHPDLVQVQKLFEKTFGKEEVDPIDVLKMAVEGKTAFGTEDETEYKIYVIKDKKGKVISVFTGGLLDLKDENNQSTEETMFMVAYAVTQERYRKSGLARESYISAIIDANVESEKAGKKLSFAAGECTYTSEHFWNGLGWKRVYAAEDNNAKNYKEVEYVQPALDFDTKTGALAPDAGNAPEHLMIDSFGKSSSNKEQLMRTVQAFYRWCNVWPKEAFEGNEQAHSNHINYIKGIENKFKEFLQTHGQLIFLDIKNREKAIGQGITIQGYKAADHGATGEEDF